MEESGNLHHHKTRRIRRPLDGLMTLAKLRSSCVGIVCLQLETLATLAAGK